MEKSWLTAVEAAELLGIHVNTLKRLPPEDLPFFRVTTRGDRRYRLTDIDDYIEARMVYYKEPVTPKVKRV
jgi:excisionase family DNA binding protein